MILISTCSFTVNYNTNPPFYPKKKTLRMTQCNFDDFLFFKKV